MVHIVGMMGIALANRLPPLEEDYALWTTEQARLLRDRRFDRLDVDNLAEEIESLGRSEQHEIRNRMVVILTHLLKWEFQPEQRSNSWIASLVENRTAIAALIKSSPSLRSHPATVIDSAYEPARYKAWSETGMALADFPEHCHYTAEQILNPKFLPGPVGD